MPHRKLKQRKHLTLRRDLGLIHATAAGVGIILGAGIYVLIGIAAGIAGPALWMSFLLAALVAVFTGLSYAELCSLFPKDAGEYVYTENAFGKKLAFIIGYGVVIGGIVTAAAVSLGFAGYFSQMFGISNTVLIAIGIIVLFSIINFRGIKQSAELNIIFTAAETFGLLMIIFLARKFIGSVDYFAMPNGFEGIISAAALIFFAFIGFEAVVKLSEETKNPTKTIPRALMLSIIISTILYCLVAVSVVSVLDWQVIAQSSAPLADVAAAVLGSKAFVILAVIALISTANTVLIDLIATSRTLYGISFNYRLLRPFSMVHEKTRTPSNAIWFIMVAAILFTFIGDIGMVAGITNFSIFITFIIINAALIRLRYSKPNLKRPFRVPLNIGRFPVLPLLGIIYSVFLMINLESIAILGGLGLFGLGFVIYYVLNKFN
ncbi:APC family permease [Nanoarchaeota archaeon]